MHKQTDFAERHKGAARAGNAWFSDLGAFGASGDPPRGHVAVHSDGTTRFYRLKRGELRDFRNWVRYTWDKPVTGRYPTYYAE